MRQTILDCDWISRLKLANQNTELPAAHKREGQKLALLLCFNINNFNLLCHTSMTSMIFKRLSLINRPQRDLMQPWIDYSKDTIGLCNLWQISKKAFFKLLHTYEFNIKGLELKHSIRLFQEFLSGNQPTSSNVSIFEQLWHYRYVPRWGVSNGARHN